jgi:hypothetical protein
MSPIKSHVTSVFEYVVIWVSHNFDVAVARLILFEQAHHDFLGMLAVAGNSCGHLCNLSTLEHYEERDITSLYTEM